MYTLLFIVYHITHTNLHNKSKYAKSPAIIKLRIAIYTLMPSDFIVVTLNVNSYLSLQMCMILAL